MMCECGVVYNYSFNQHRWTDEHLTYERLQYEYRLDSLLYWAREWLQTFVPLSNLNVEL